MEQINLRIKQLIELLGLTQNAFAKALSTSSSRVSNVTTGRNKPDFDLIQNILTVFRNVNSEWLLLGEGEALKKQGNLKGNPMGNVTHFSGPKADYLKTKIQDAEIIDLSEDKPIISMDYITGKTLRILPIQVDPETNKERITMVSTKVAAGYADNLESREFVQQLPGFNLPLPVFNSGTFRCFEVTGESMAKELMPGHIVFGRYVDDFTKIHNGLVYIVAYRGEDRPVIKRVKNRISKLGKLILQSDNKDYETYSVDIDDVKEVWEYVAHMKFGIHRTEHQIAVDVNDLKETVYLLQEEMKRIKKTLDK